MENMVLSRLSKLSDYLTEQGLYAEAADVWALNEFKKEAATTDAVLNVLIDLIEGIESYTPWSSHSGNNIEWKRVGVLQGGRIYFCGHRLSTMIGMLRRSYVQRKIPKEHWGKFEEVAEKIGNLNSLKEGLQWIWRALRITMNVDVTRTVEDSVWDTLQNSLANSNLDELCALIPSLGDVISEGAGKIGDVISSPFQMGSDMASSAMGTLERDETGYWTAASRPSNNPIFILKRKNIQSQVGGKYLDKDGEEASISAEIETPDSICPGGMCLGWDVLKYEMRVFENEAIKRLNLIELEKTDAKAHAAARKALYQEFLQFLIEKGKEQARIRSDLN